MFILPNLIVIFTVGDYCISSYKDLDLLLVRYLPDKVNPAISNLRRSQPPKDMTLATALVIH